MRSAIATAGLLLLVPEARRRWNWRIVLVALAYAGTMISFVTATKLTTAANAILLQSAAPAYVLVLAPWLLAERVRRIDVATMLVIAAGLALVLSGATGATSTAPDPATGNVLGAASGIGMALTMVGLRWLGTRTSAGAAGRADPSAGTATIVAGNALACAMCLTMALPLSGATTVDWAVLGYLGVFQIGLAYVLVTRGLRGVPAVEASMLLLIEPALNPVWVWLVHGETPGVRTIAGGALILAATVARSLAARDADEGR